MDFGHNRRAKQLILDTRRPAISLHLAYSPPYAWDQMLAFLGARAIPGVEVVSGDQYARSVSIDGDSGDHGIIVVAPGRAGELSLRVHGSRRRALPAIITRLRRMFDLASDQRAIDAHLATDPLLAPLVAARPGLRVAGAWAGFELAVRAILGQQITIRAARGLAAKLVASLGQPLDPSLSAIYPGLTHLFPTPALVASADLTKLGMPKARAATLNALGQLLQRSPDTLTQGRDFQHSMQLFMSLRGIGDWTAQYVAMRALGEPDAFPVTDVALLRAAAAICGRSVSPAQLLARSERWRPWRAYAAEHLWASLRPSPPPAIPSGRRNRGVAAIAAPIVRAASHGPRS